MRRTRKKYPRWMTMPTPVAKSWVRFLYELNILKDEGQQLFCVLVAIEQLKDGWRVHHKKRVVRR